MAETYRVFVGERFPHCGLESSNMSEEVELRLLELHGKLTL